MKKSGKVGNYVFLIQFFMPNSNMRSEFENSLKIRIFIFFIDFYIYFYILMTDYMLPMDFFIIFFCKFFNKSLFQTKKYSCKFSFKCILKKSVTYGQNCSKFIRAPKKAIWAIYGIQAQNHVLR